MPSTFSSYFKIPAVITPYTGLSGLGKPTYSDDIEIKVWYECKTKRVVNSKGQEITASGFFYTDTQLSAAEGSLFKVQDKVFTIIGIFPAPNLSGDIDHFEGWFK